MTDTSILEDTKEENGKRVLQDMQDLFPFFSVLFLTFMVLYGLCENRFITKRICKVFMNRERQHVKTDEMEWILESILNDSTQMIQVSDLETYTMLYANEPARSDAGHGWI